MPVAAPVSLGPSAVPWAPWLTAGHNAGLPNAPDPASHSSASAVDLDRWVSVSAHGTRHGQVCHSVRTPGNADVSNTC